MFTGKKVVKGVIYDNPNIAEEEAYKVSATLSGIMDAIEDDAFKNYDFSKCPNRDEYLTSMLIHNVIAPCNGELGYNMIIPADMVDGKLRNELRKIDIGPQIIQQFIDIREENYANKMNESSEEVHEIVDVADIKDENTNEFVTVYVNDKPIGKMDKSEAASYIRELFSLAG